VRRKMGLSKDDRDSHPNTDQYFLRPGFGVQKQKGSESSHYSAGNQKHFLRKRSGVPMSIRTGGSARGGSASFINLSRQAAGEVATSLSGLGTKYFEPVHNVSSRDQRSNNRLSSTPELTRTQRRSVPSTNSGRSGFQPPMQHLEESWAPELESAGPNTSTLKEFQKSDKHRGNGMPSHSDSGLIPSSDSQWKSDERKIAFDTSIQGKNFSDFDVINDNYKIEFIAPNMPTTISYAVQQATAGKNRRIIGTLPDNKNLCFPTGTSVSHAEINHGR